MDKTRQINVLEVIDFKKLNKVFSNGQKTLSVSTKNKVEFILNKADNKIFMKESFFDVKEVAEKLPVGQGVVLIKYADDDRIFARGDSIDLKSHEALENLRKQLVGTYFHKGSKSLLVTKELEEGVKVSVKFFILKKINQQNLTYTNSCNFSQYSPKRNLTDSYISSRG